MKTKKIWFLAFTFGIIVTMIVYIGLFSNYSTIATSSDKKEPVEEVLKEEPIEKTEPAKREFPNPKLEIEKGKRAISLYAALAEGASGYIEPGSYVDIIAYETTKKEDGTTEKEFKSAVLVLQNVKVLASGKSSSSTEEAMLYETITVEVNPEEGVILSLAAKDKDGFYFMVRNEEDDEVKSEVIKETREVFQEGGNG